MKRAGQEILIVPGLNLLFLTLIALVLWPMDRAALAYSMAKGYALLWAALWISVMLLSLVERVLRRDPETHYRSYISVNLLVSAFLVAGWSAFAAFTVGSSAAATPIWAAAVLYVIGFLSSYLAFVVATEFYSGSVYKVVNLPLALVSYLVFVAWPAAGRAVSGWFFSLFG